MTDEAVTDDAVTDDAVLTVLKGNPTPEEVVALVTVLLSTPAAQPGAPRPESGWSAYRRAVRAPLQPGPHAWRLSGR